MNTTETPRFAHPTPDHAMTVKPGKGARQSAVVPDHLRFARSLREALTISCNIRFMPKKATVRAMAEHATEVPDRAGLLWMSSLDGTKEYNALRSQGYTLLDVLRKFPSCRSVRPCLYTVENNLCAAHQHVRAAHQNVARHDE